MNRSRAGATAAGLLTAVLLSGPVAAAPPVAEPDGGRHRVAALIVAEQGIPAPAPSAGSEVVAFGDDHGIVWDDKVQASVLSAESYQPDPDAAGLFPGHRGVRITIKITNGSTEPVDLTDAAVTLKAGPDGRQAERLFDVGNGIGAGFEGSVAPGRSATADYGFSVSPENLGLLDVELAPNLDYVPAIFEGAADE
jgi:hypothetical protein